MERVMLFHPSRGSWLVAAAALYSLPLAAGTDWQDGPRVASHAFENFDCAGPYSLPQAKEACEADPQCKVLHSYACHTQFWRACRASIGQLAAAGNEDENACTMVPGTNHSDLYELTRPFLNDASHVHYFRDGPYVHSNAFFQRCAGNVGRLEDTINACDSDPQCHSVISYDCNPLLTCVSTSNRQELNECCSDDYQVLFLNTGAGFSCGWSKEIRTTYTTLTTASTTHTTGTATSDTATSRTSTTLTATTGTTVSATTLTTQTDFKFAVGPWVDNQAIYTTCLPPFGTLAEAQERCWSTPGCSVIHAFDCLAWAWSACTGDMEEVKMAGLGTQACTMVDSRLVTETSLTTHITETETTTSRTVTTQTTTTRTTRTSTVTDTSSTRTAITQTTATTTTASTTTASTTTASTTTATATSTSVTGTSLSSSSTAISWTSFTFTTGTTTATTTATQVTNTSATTATSATTTTATTFSDTTGSGTSSTSVSGTSLSVSVTSSTMTSRSLTFSATSGTATESSSTTGVTTTSSSSGTSMSESSSTSGTTSTSVSATFTMSSTVTETVTITSSTVSATTTTTSFTDTTETTPRPKALCSVRSCDELDWPDAPYYTAIVSGVCGQRPSSCQGAGSHVDAETYCFSLGARLCTANELMSCEGARLGCKYDFEWMWSSTPCNGGHLAVRPSEHCASPESICMNSSLGYYGRCCADSNPTASHCLVTDTSTSFSQTGTSTSLTSTSETGTATATDTSTPTNTMTMTDTSTGSATESSGTITTGSFTTPMTMFSVTSSGTETLTSTTVTSSTSTSSTSGSETTNGETSNNSATGTATATTETSTTRSSLSLTSLSATSTATRTATATTVAAVVEGSFQLQVSNAAEFVANAGAVRALESSIAKLAGVRDDQVRVRFSVRSGERRLSADGADSSVVVDYEIFPGSMDGASSVSTALQSVSAGDVSTTLDQTFEEHGMSEWAGSVQVSSFTVQASTTVDIGGDSGAKTEETSTNAAVIASLLVGLALVAGCAVYGFWTLCRAGAFFQRRAEADSKQGAQGAYAEESQTNKRSAIYDSDEPAGKVQDVSQTRSEYGHVEFDVDGSPRESGIEHIPAGEHRLWETSQAQQPSISRASYSSSQSAFATAQATPPILALSASPSRAGDTHGITATGPPSVPEAQERSDPWAVAGSWLASATASLMSERIFGGSTSSAEEAPPPVSSAGSSSHHTVEAWLSPPTGSGAWLDAGKGAARTEDNPSSSSTSPGNGSTSRWRAWSVRAEQTLPRCPSGHVLQALATQHDQYRKFRCDSCMVFQPMGDEVMSCRPCNYDVCKSCYSKTQASSAMSPCLEESADSGNSGVKNEDGVIDIESANGVDGSSAAGMDHHVKAREETDLVGTALSPVTPVVPRAVLSASNAVASGGSSEPGARAVASWPQDPRQAEQRSRVTSTPARRGHRQVQVEVHDEADQKVIEDSPMPLEAHEEAGNEGLAASAAMPEEPEPVSSTESNQHSSRRSEAEGSCAASQDPVPALPTQPGLRPVESGRSVELMSEISEVPSIGCEEGRVGIMPCREFETWDDDDKVDGVSTEAAGKDASMDIV